MTPSEMGRFSGSGGAESGVRTELADTDRGFLANRGLRFLMRLACSGMFAGSGPGFLAWLEATEAGDNEYGTRGSFRFLAGEGIVRFVMFKTTRLFMWIDS